MGSGVVPKLEFRGIGYLSVFCEKFQNLYNNIFCYSFLCFNHILLSQGFAFLSFC